MKNILIFTAWMGGCIGLVAWWHHRHPADPQPPVGPSPLDAWPLEDD